MTWCNTCGYDYGVTSHSCGGGGNIPQPSTRLAGVELYPCNYGVGSPKGYHRFEANKYGVVVCVLCGAFPKKDGA